MVKSPFSSLLLLIVLTCVAACTGDRIAVAEPTQDTVISSPQPTLQTVADRSFQNITSPTPTGCQGESIPQHTVNVFIDYTNRHVVVKQHILFTNLTENSLGHVLLHIEPNRWQDTFELDTLKIDKDQIDYDLNERQLRIELPQQLEPRCTVSIEAEYTLTVPYIGDPISPSKGYFGATHRQINLGHWLMTVAAYQDGEWQSRPSTFIGEHELVDVADWDVTLNLVDPPDNMQIAAPGVRAGNNGGSSRYTFESARDFSVSLSNHYVIDTQETAFDTEVELYTFDSLGENGAREQALTIAAQSVNAFSALFGTYPHERLVIIQGDFPDGMELSGLAFVGNNWFDRYPGGEQNYLTLITAHEVAHQWWYAAVGNDPAQTPWLDESLATYSEYLFLEQNYPELTDWWWSFRVNAFSPTGMVDSTIYEFETARDYINAVYLRGVSMLHDLRGDIGDEAFFTLMRDYYTLSQDQIATPAMFWSLLDAEQYDLTQGTRTEYFNQPEFLQGSG